MPNRREVSNRTKSQSKASSTLQMWQHQMAALQRVSEVRPDKQAHQVLGRNASEIQNNGKSTLIYPHIL